MTKEQLRERMAEDLDDWAVSRYSTNPSTLLVEDFLLERGWILNPVPTEPTQNCKDFVNEAGDLVSVNPLRY